MPDSSTGLVPLGTYGVNGNALQTIFDLIPNIDSTSSSGSQAGGAGGFLDEMSPVAAVQLRAELQAAMDAFGAEGFATGQYTATAGDATADAMSIPTGLTDLTLSKCAISIFRAGTYVGPMESVITESPAGTIVITQDASTPIYTITAGDIVNWFARV